MLVLTRGLGEKIMIGDDIVISVEDLRYNSVQIGVQAPRDVPIHRQEIHEAIQRERREKS